jgi:hypothetical protein
LVANGIDKFLCVGVWWRDHSSEDGRSRWEHILMIKSIINLFSCFWFGYNPEQFLANFLWEHNK